MLRILRIVLAEFLLVCFIASTVVSPLVYAEESVQLTEVVDSTGSTTEPPLSESAPQDIQDSGSTASGDLVGEDILSGSGIESESLDTFQGAEDVSTGSVSTDSGRTLVTDTLIQENSSGSITAQYDTEDDEARYVAHIDSHTRQQINDTNQILVQFHTDIDGYLGGYQVEQLAANNNLITSELIVENNIAVMSVAQGEDPTRYVSESSSGSIVSQFTDNTSDMVDATINTLKQDPRVAHVQKNFIYTIASSYSPLSIWQNTSTGVTTSIGKVEYFQIIAPSTVIVNQSFDVTIRPKDINGLTVTNYTGSFIFISDYFEDIVPSSGQAIVFSGSNGEMVFPLGMRSGNVGQNSIEIVDVEDRNITGVTKINVMSVIPISVNDPDFSKLWGLHNDGQSVDGTVGTIDADIDYPEAMAYASGRIGTGVIVAVLDTGIAYDHPELSDNMWDGSQCVSDTGASLGGCMHGYDFAYDDTVPTDMDGHGTHVAGTIGAVTGNGTGVTGVSPQVQLMAVKVLSDDGWGSTADIIRGINFARHNGAKVINASFGGTDFIQSKLDFDFLTYQAIQDFPGLFVAAAGNSSLNVNEGLRSYPAAFGADTVVSGEMIIDRELVVSGEEIIPGLQNVISVAASDQDDYLAYFSNYGTNTVHIAAPGTNIYSTVPHYISTGSTTSRISYSNGWTRQVSSGTGSWNTRIVDTVSGELTMTGEEAIDLISVLWGDTRYPYVSGESSYIQKTFANPDKNINSILLSVWCDSPDSYYGDPSDRLDVLVSTGGLFEKQFHLNENNLRSSWSKSKRDIEINGHIGAYSIYEMYGSDLSEINKSTSFDLRLKWVSEGVSDTHYGCFVNNITIDYAQFEPSYDSYAGTSMASPHVAGAAALAMGYAPDVSIWDIRNAILWTSDYKSQFSDKVMFGRLNVANMLKGLERPTITSTRVTLSGESGAKIQVQTSVDNEQIYKHITLSKNQNFFGTSGMLPGIETLYAHGIISSRSEDGLNDNMTRAETARIIAKIGGYSPTTCIGIFSDVNSNLGDLCGYIEVLAHNNIILTGSTFRPYANITHGEFYKMLIGALGEQPSAVGNLEFDRYGNRIQELGCGINGNYLESIDLRFIYFMSICTSKMQDVTDTRIYGNGYGEPIVDITELSPDTIYYYYAEVSSTTFYSSTRHIYQSFRTPKFVSPIASGSLVGSGSTFYLSGSSASGVTYGTGGTQKLMLSDIGSTAIMELSLTGLTITTSGSWDGIFVAPKVVATNTSIILASGSTISAETVYEIGSPETSLVLSGKLATIRIKTSQTVGTTLRVYRSDNAGSTFIDIGSCTVIGGECVFTTNHFSQFTIGNPIYPSLSIVSGGGEGGAGGGSSSSNVLNSTTHFLSGKVLFDTLYNQTNPEEVISKNTLSELHSIVKFLSVEILDVDNNTIIDIENRLLDSVDILGTTKIKKLILYDINITAINYLLKEYPSIRSREYKVLIKVKKTLKNERNAFIQESILGSKK